MKTVSLYLFLFVLFITTIVSCNSGESLKSRELNGEDYKVITPAAYAKQLKNGDISIGEKFVIDGTVFGSSENTVMLQKAGITNVFTLGEQLDLKMGEKVRLYIEVALINTALVNLSEAKVAKIEFLSGGREALTFVAGDSEALLINRVDPMINPKSVELMMDTVYSGVYPSTPRGSIICIKFFSNGKYERWYEEITGSGSNRENLDSGWYYLSNRNGLDFIAISDWQLGGPGPTGAGVEVSPQVFLTNNALQELYIFLPGYSFYGEPKFEPDFRNSESALHGYTRFGDGSWIRASSAFRETLGGRVKEYSPDKLGIVSGECWVPLNETNESLTLTINQRQQMFEETIYISSGFVSISEANLYRENSRVRKLRVSDTLGNSSIVELLDTPHFQPISLQGIGISKDGPSIVTLEILEVYPGTKYRDVCVNSISWKLMP